MSVNMAETIIAKSDQLNAMDIIDGPRILRITRVQRNRNDDQPISIYYEGDNGKPYKPNKGMRRALVFLWGEEGEDYVGRILEVFFAQEVTWGGEAVGGIRIGRASHINGAVTFPLQISKAKRTLYTVEPLPMDRQPERPRKSLADHVDGYVAAIEGADSLEALAAVQQSEGAQKVRTAASKPGNEAQLARMNDAGSKRYAELSPAPDVQDDADEPEYSSDEPEDHDDGGEFDDGGFDDDADQA